ncbi:MAG TPA: choice-of-anchor D domain-containing protein [Albitalea sp.]|nr:choice-of-anchor D domain-containing protein [Albitalea sp.]
MAVDIGRAIARALLGIVAALVFAAPAQATNDWENGRALHISNGCTGCHAAHYGKTLTDLNNAIGGGVPAMAGFASLSASDRSDIAAYLGTFGNFPKISVSTSTVSFATTAVGATRTSNVRVTNNGFCDNPAIGCGGSNLNVTSAAVSDTTNYDVSPTTCSNIGISSFCDLTVTFQPQSAAAFNARTLTITSNSLVATSTVTLNGTGERPNFAISPGSFAFTAKVGSTAQQTFTVSNSSSVATLDLTSITVAPSPRYTQVGGTCATAGTNNVGTNGSCTIIVQFAPDAFGAAAAGTLTVGHDADNVASPATVNLSGTGTQATVSASAGTLPFDTVQIGVPKTLSVTVNNTGNASLVFATDPTSAGARTGAGKDDYTVAGTCSTATPVSAGSSCTLDVTFTPTVLGSRPATLTVASDATNSPLVVTFTGSGVVLPEPVVTFPASDFPDTAIGETAVQTRQVTIVNSRTLDIGYSVANTADFNVQSESCPSHVVPGGGGSCTVTWRFQPQLAGGETRRTANVTFNFTGTGGNPAPSSVGGVLAGRALFPLGAPTSLAPNAGFGLPATTSTLLSNRSASAIVLSTLAFSGTAAGDYSLDATNACTAGLSLASGTSCTLVVRFDPTTGGTRNATLTITHNALGSPQAIALNGSATQGAILLSSFALSFPSTALNASAQQSITVQNNGTQALNFSAFSVSGAASGDYTRSGNCAVGTSLATGVQCTLTVTFQPTALGTRSASLTIQSDASNGPATVSLTGTGVAIPVPVVTLTPSSLDFGTQTLGNLYPTRTIRLSNSGTADLHTTSVVVEGTTFSTASTCPNTLAPGAGCDVQIRFTPLAANTDYTGTLRVVSDAAGSPHTAPLAGRGSVATLAALTWSPLVAELDYGTVTSGTVSAAQTATLLNQGPGGVTLTLLNAVGADASSFAVTGGTCAVGAALFEGQSCTVQVQFAPFAAGVRHAQLQIASTGSFPPTLTLTGTGLGGPSPGLAVSAAALAFDDTRVGAQSAPGELRLSSNGSGVLRVTDFVVTGPYTVQSKSCPSVPFTLAAGSECTLSVVFVPQAEGAAAGTLQVASDASVAVPQVTLSGRGEAKADLASGGCSIASGDTLLDPSLWLLALGALGALIYRRRRSR